MPTKQEQQSKGKEKKTVRNRIKKEKARKERRHREQIIGTSP